MTGFNLELPFAYIGCLIKVKEKIGLIYYLFIDRRNISVHCCIAIIIMISITKVHILMQIQGNTNHNKVDSNTHATPLFSYERLLTFGLSSTRGERETILKSLSWLYYANKTPNCLVRPQLLTIMVGPQLQLFASMADNPTVCQLPTDPFSKSSNSQDHRFRAWRNSLQPHFLSGVYYDNCDCHILCARA